MVIIGREITAQYETEIALRQSEGKHKAVANLMRLMCDNVPDLIWAKDMNGHFLFTNQAMCTKLLNAQDTDEPIGKTDLFFAQRERTRHSSNPNGTRLVRFVLIQMMSSWNNGYLNVF